MTTDTSDRIKLKVRSVTVKRVRFFIPDTARLTIVRKS